MGEVLGGMYCLLEDFLGFELANYLWGQSSPLQQGNMYIGIGLTMLAVSFVLMMVYYYVVNHPRLNNWWGWAIFFDSERSDQLCHWLAVGVQISADTVVPIVIDPDAANADLNRTVALMNNYRDMRSHLSFVPNAPTQFFRTELRQVLSNYTLRILGTQKQLFRQFIDLFNLGCGNKPFDVVTGVTPKKIVSLKSAYDLMAAHLNAAVRKSHTGEDCNKFLEMFYRATQNLVKEKFNL